MGKFLFSLKLHTHIIYNISCWQGATSFTTSIPMLFSISVHFFGEFVFINYSGTFFGRLSPPTFTLFLLLFCILKLPISYLIICCRVHYNNGSYLSFVITITVLQLNFYSGIFHWNDNSSIFVRYLLQKFYGCNHSWKLFYHISFLM